MAASPVEADGRAGVITAFAHAQLGDWYRFGATGPSTWDCSGLVMAAYRAAGVELPHLASAIPRASGMHRVAAGEWQPGDAIIMLGGRHTAVYIGNGLMIEAAHTGTRVRIAPTRGGFAVRYW